MAFHGLILLVFQMSFLSWDGSEFEGWVGSIAQFSQCFIVLSRLLFVLYLMYYKVSRKLICKLGKE
jgi:hypothetical protein